MKHTHLISALVAGSFMLGTSAAQATNVTLLDVNFDGITSTSAVSVSSLLANLPNGTQWSSTTNANDVNLRTGADAINTYNAGNPLQRFSITPGGNYFLPATTANNFLVMGDTSGQLAGSPTAGTFGFALPFALVNGTTDITVTFDWVFSVFPLNTTIADTDQFKVGVSGNGYSVSSPLSVTTQIVNQSITATTATGGNKYHGPTTVTLSLASLGAADGNGEYWLSFGYFEANASNNNNGAVGIDNIKITANVAPVPVPGGIWLMGSALLGMTAIGRKKA